MNNHLFVHAAAGSGKTERIVRACANRDRPKRRLIITLTESGQEELISRLSAACSADQVPDVIGWYAFLIKHYVRPYLPCLFDEVRPTGFIFDRNLHPKDHFRLKGEARYFSSNGSIYRESLPELSVKVAEAAQGKVENRLSRIYDEIIIDEVQDISRKSLDILARLLDFTSLRLVMVGDVRQSLLDSDLMSSRNKNADRLQLLSWYRDHEKSERLTIEEMTTTFRSNQTIASFSDAIFPPELGFAPTTSANKEITGHDGVFLVLEPHLNDYVQRYGAVLLRGSAASGKHLNHLGFTNIGQVKGLTYDRVIIYPTQPMLDLISTGKAMAAKSACSFYVAVTRARLSVAIIVDSKKLTKRLQDNPTLPIEWWEPPECESDASDGAKKDWSGDTAEPFSGRNGLALRKDVPRALVQDAHLGWLDA
ncbi:AAA family ATPase [Actinomyces sp. F1_1611]